MQRRIRTRTSPHPELLEVRTLLSAAYAIEPLANINPSTASTQFAEFVDAGSRLYFVVEDRPADRDRLMVLEPGGQPTLLRSFDSQQSQEGVQQLTVVGDTVFFRAYTGSYGFELWKSDGTRSGTKLVRDINPGEDSSGLGDMVAFNDVLLFEGYTDEHGLELWRSDGSEDGTFLVRDIRAGSDHSFVRNLHQVGDLVFFSASNRDGELWATDGTEAGTYEVRNINPISSSLPGNFVTFNEQLYFTASDGVHGTEIWSSDGTESGTRMVADTQLGSSGGAWGQLTVSGSQLFFIGNDGEHGSELWVTDGTENGTRMTRDILEGPGSPGLDRERMVAFGNGVVFAANDRVAGYQVWLSDGTTAGTRLLDPNARADSYPSEFTAVGDKLFFAANDARSNDSELWISDGTAEGTRTVMPLDPGSSYPRHLLEFDNQLYYVGRDEFSGHEIWRTDGTDANTQLVADLSQTGVGSRASDYTVAGDRLFFGANDGSHGRDLWMWDGTAQPELVHDFNTYTTGRFRYNPRYFGVAGDRVYFSGGDVSNGEELWTSDGTDAGTIRLTRLLDSDAPPRNLVDLNGVAFFQDRDGVVYRSEGTLESTYRVQFDQPLKDFGFGLVKFNDAIYFTAELTGSRDRYVWRTDGTAEGTQNVTQIIPEFTGLRTDAVIAGEWMYFTQGNELWKTDGTAQNTHKIPSDEQLSDLRQPTLVGTSIYLSAFTEETGYELWQYSESTGMLTLVKDIVTDGSARPLHLTALDDRLFFTAHTDDTGRELWATDGTEAGTQMVTEIRPGSDDGIGSQASLVAHNGAVLFAGNDGITGVELWISDGRSTELVVDANPGPASSVPTGLTGFGPTLVTTMVTEALGSEPWVLTGFDYGDAPASYSPADLTDGARHAESDLFLGQMVDSEFMPRATDRSDDGVKLPGSMLTGSQPNVTITASAAGHVDAWIDFNGDGRWSDDEQILNGHSVTEGKNVVQISIPNVPSVRSFARFRVSTDGGLTPNGAATNGEVEDYPVVIVQSGIEVVGSTLRIFGTDGPDKITVTRRGETVVASMNSDVLRVGADRFKTISVLARGGNDRVVISTDHRAVIRGGGGADQLEGGSANDRITGGSGPDVIRGQAGDDNLTGDTAADTIFGGAGDDFIAGGGSHDRLFGDAGNDRVSGGGGADSIDGGEGDDQLRGGSKPDSLFGQAGDDTIDGGSGADLADGGGGNDRIAGDGGRDFLIGGVGSDTLTGGASQDLLVSDSLLLSDVEKLLAVRIWQTTRNYHRAVARLADGTDAHLRDSNLRSDNVVDELFGSTDRDWFLAELNDLLQDRESDERFDEIS